MRSVPKIKYFVGDVRRVLKGMPNSSVQCAVTSPPYYGLRDYEIPPSIWGGDPECEHEWGEEMIALSKDSNRGDMEWSTGGDPGAKVHGKNPSQGAYCRCGAWRGCLGLEPTLDMYIEHIIEVCRELWWDMRPDGVFFFNLGDSYAANRSYQVSDSKHIDVGNIKGSVVPDDLKPKDQLLMPHRVVMALQAPWRQCLKCGKEYHDHYWGKVKKPGGATYFICPNCLKIRLHKKTQPGWGVRSTIVWAKKNPMPESCTDRPTSAHEYIFELTRSSKTTYWTNAYRRKGVRKQPDPDYLYFDLKNDVVYEEEPKDFDPKAKDKDGNLLWNRENQWKAHDYFYDADAVREKMDEETRRAITFRDDRYVNNETFNKSTKFKGKIKVIDGEPGVGRNLRNVWHIEEDEFEQFLRWKAEHAGDLKDVWDLATQSFPEAHFATFPEKIPEICIRAGTSEKGCCPKCGAPWERVVEKSDDRHWTERGNYNSPKMQALKATGYRNDGGGAFEGSSNVTKGFQPTCDCPDNTGDGRCVVLDPFAGSGTTLLVGYNMGRDVIGIDISKEYAKMASKRIKDGANFQEPLDTFE